MGAEFYHALFWLCVGVTTTVMSWRYSLGSLTDPGPGALPFGLGLLFILLSLLLLAQSLSGPRIRGGGPRLPTGRGWRKVILVLLTIAASAFFFETLGYLLTVFSLVAVSMVLVEPRRWRLALVTGIVSSVASYVIFDVWLMVQLPRGIFSL